MTVSMRARVMVLVLAAVSATASRRAAAQDEACQFKPATLADGRAALAPTASTSSTALAVQALQKAAEELKATETAWQEAIKAWKEASASKDTSNAQLNALQSVATKLTARLDSAAASGTKLELSASTRIAIHLANPPPTRLRLSFDSDSGRHVEAEWDPTVASELGRTITLVEGTWRITVAVEPSTYTQNAGSVIIHTRFAAPVIGNHGKAATLDGLHVAMIAALNTAPKAEEQVMDGWPHPRLSLACGELPRMDDAQFAPVPAVHGAAGLRGFGVAPSVVTDTLSLLAEIATDRAKAGAMNLLRKRLVDPFCVTPATRVTLTKLGITSSDELALPRTCELLTSLRLDDILSSGRPLLIALRDDLRRTVAPAAVKRIVGNDGLANVVLQSALTLVNTAIDRGGIDALDSQLALELLGNVEKLGVALAPELVLKMEGLVDKALAGEVDATIAGLVTGLALSCPPPADCRTMVRTALVQLLRTPLTLRAAVGLGPDKQQPVVALLRRALDDSSRVNELVADACQARLAIAAIKRCQHDGCSASDVTGMVSRPERYFAVDDTLPLALCWTTTGRYRATSADATAVQQLIVDGIRLVAPVVDGKGRERAKAVVRLMIELLRRWQHDVALDRYAESFAEIAEALIDEDYSTALNGFVRLAGKLQPGPVPAPITKVVQLIGAVSSYAAIYKQTKDDDPKASREARKQALESLINSATDRTDRDNDTILSLGSNVGLSSTWTEGGGWGGYEPSVRVPIAFMVDIRKSGPVAFRAGLQLADLGQFVRRGSDDKLDEVRWNDFVSPGVEVGISIPKLGRALNLSLHASYAPTISRRGPDTMDPGMMDPGMMPAIDMEPGDGVWRYGVSLSYYVPFFDFN